MSQRSIIIENLEDETHIVAGKLVLAVSRKAEFDLKEKIITVKPYEHLGSQKSLNFEQMDCSSDFQSADFAQDFIVQAPGVKTISVPIANAD